MHPVQPVVLVKPTIDNEISPSDVAGPLIINKELDGGSNLLSLPNAPKRDGLRATRDQFPSIENMIRPSVDRPGRDSVDPNPMRPSSQASSFMSILSPALATE